MKSNLEIKQYCLSVSIGCTPEEHKEQQKVSFDVIIQFAQLPNACLTDNLPDSYCYAQITAEIAEICHQKHYKLIEHLAYSVFDAIKKMLKPQDKLFLRAHKLKPPVNNLEGGAAFCCVDESHFLMPFFQ
jgi:dihydroneopterin aldolase